LILRAHQHFLNPLVFYARRAPFSIEAGWKRVRERLDCKRVFVPALFSKHVRFKNAARHAFVVAHVIADLHANPRYKKGVRVQVLLQ
jgi:hypothetical protein